MMQLLTSVTPIESGIIMVSEYDIEDSLESIILLSLLFAVVNGIDTRTNSTSTQIRAFLMQIYDEYTILFLRQYRTEKSARYRQV